MNHSKSKIFNQQLIWGIVVVIWIPCVAACGGLNASNGAIQAPVSIEKLEMGGRSFLPGDKMHFAVYASGDTFSKTYSQIHAGTLPRPTAPAIDFERRLVVGAFLGQRPTANHEIDLGPASTASDDSAKYLEMRVRISEPPAGTMTAQVVTSPYVLVQVPREPWRGVRFVDMEGRLLAEIPLRDFQ